MKDTTERLSRSFTRREMERSETAQRRGIGNTMPPAALAAMRALVEDVLQPLRDRLGVPITVTSGYRSAALNAAVGGARTSQHVRGEAVDIEVAGMTTTQLMRYIIASGLPFDQLIDEAAPDGWVHLSYRRAGPNRREALAARFTAKGVTYSPFRP